MIRLFVALPLPPEISSKLALLGQTILGVRSVPEHQFHLTLRFIGELEGQKFNDIRDSLSEIQDEPITFSIKGVGHFPPRGEPRVIWAGVDPQNEIIQLRNKVNNVLKQCNVKPEQRKFHPHITLARLKNSSAQRISSFLEINALLQSPRFTVNSFCLYSSQLGYDGAKHSLEREYLLL